MHDITDCDTLSSKQKMPIKMHYELLLFIDFPLFQRWSQYIQHESKSLLRKTNVLSSVEGACQYLTVKGSFV